MLTPGVSLNQYTTLLMPKHHTENEPRAKGVLDLNLFLEINSPEDIAEHIKCKCDQCLAEFWMCLANKNSQLGIHGYI